MLFEGREWLVWDTYVSLQEVTTPGTPETNQVRLYAKDKTGVSNLYFLDDAGVEHDMAPTIISGSGAVGQVAFWTAATVLSGEAALFWDSTNDRLGIGGSAAPDFPFHLSIDAAGAAVQPVIDKFGVNAGPLLIGRAAKGSRTTPTQMVANDLLFGIAGQGRHNGGGWSSGNPAAIRFKATETFTTIAQGAYISLETTAAGSVAPAERFRIGPSGELGIGGATYGTAGFYFRSGGALAPPTWTAIPYDSANFTGTNWTDLTDGGATTLHSHAGGGAQTPWASNIDGAGFTLYGNSTAGGDLTLSSTSHATKGSIFAGANLTLDESEATFNTAWWADFSAPFWLNKTYTSFPTDSGINLYNRMELDPAANVTAIIAASAVELSTKAGNAKDFLYLIGEECDVIHNGSGDVDTIYGILSNAYHAGSGDIGDLYGITGTAFSFGGGNTNLQVGCLYNSFIKDTSTCDFNMGLKILTGSFGTGGSVGNNYGVYINLAGAALPITNNYGLYVSDHSIAGSADSFNIYSQEPGKNYFGNHILIGTLLPPTTGTAGLIFGDGAALVTMASNTAGLYADNIAGNVSIHVINENGDIIKLIKTGTYTPSNVTTDRSYDANSTSVDELADVLGTLIADLQLTGLIV